MSRKEKKNMLRPFIVDVIRPRPLPIPEKKCERRSEAKKKHATNEMDTETLPSDASTANGIEKNRERIGPKVVADDGGTDNKTIDSTLKSSNPTISNLGYVGKMVFECGRKLEERVKSREKERELAERCNLPLFFDVETRDAFRGCVKAFVLFVVISCVYFATHVTIVLPRLSCSTWCMFDYRVFHSWNPFLFTDVWCLVGNWLAIYLVANVTFASFLFLATTVPRTFDFWSDLARNFFREYVREIEICIFGASKFVLRCADFLDKNETLDRTKNAVVRSLFERKKTAVGRKVGKERDARSISTDGDDYDGPSICRNDDGLYGTFVVSKNIGRSSTRGSETVDRRKESRSTRSHRYVDREKIYPSTEKDERARRKKKEKRTDRTTKIFTEKRERNVRRTARRDLAKEEGCYDGDDSERKLVEKVLSKIVRELEEIAKFRDRDRFSNGRCERCEISRCEVNSSSVLLSNPKESSYTNEISSNELDECS